MHANQLIRLDELMAAGRGDSTEADTLRDEMDHTWYEMSSDELDVARQLSADLYTLHNDPLVQHPSDFQIYASDLADQLAMLISRGEYLSALKLIQDRCHDISIERASLFRAILYKSLGLPEVGLVFFKFVAAPSGTSGSPSTPVVGFLWQHAEFDFTSVAT
jgi:hypothetical protein